MMKLMLVTRKQNKKNWKHTFLDIILSWTILQPKEGSKYPTEVPGYRYNNRLPVSTSYQFNASDAWRTLCFIFTKWLFSLCSEIRDDRKFNLIWGWSIFFFFFFWPFCLFRATPAVYGGSQARGPIGAVAAGLHHSHSNTTSELHLRPTPQLTAMLDP